ncbi:MAG: hypothetical protein HY926_06870 [Elusimicrobia bacterium]|nr:hypothetical protein [Elusimicrobiota bacterium]
MIPAWALLLGAVCVRAAESPALLPAAALSPGTGRPVTARITYDRGRAKEGGAILVLPGFSDSDAAVARLAEALILGSGGAGGRGAAFARGRRIPAVALESAVWADGVLEARAPVLGRPQSQDGVSFQVAEKTVPVRLREGDVVTVDPVQGTVALSAPEDAESDLAAAEALRAYDGLRDGQALRHWWAARAGADARAGVAAAAGLAARVADGGVRADDFSAFSRAVAAGLPPALRKRLAEEQRRVLGEAAAQAQRSLRQELGSVREAATALAVERILARAQTRWEGLQALAAALSEKSRLRGCAALWQELSRAAAQRRQVLSSAAVSDPLTAAAAAAGAEIPPRAAFGEVEWRLFLAEGRLDAPLARILDDASLDLRRRSARLRSLLLERGLPEGSELGRRILGNLPPAQSYSVAGAYEVIPDVPAAGVLGAVFRAWAAGFDPGPLGARKRAAQSGLPALFASSVDVTALPQAEVSGTVFSREPAAGRRERLLVAAAKPGGAAQETVLENRTGRELRPAGAGRLLEARDLAVLARAARSLDDHEGRGVELEFCKAAGKLYLLGSRPIAGLDEEPARAAPFTVEVPASATVAPVQALRR